MTHKIKIISLLAFLLMSFIGNEASSSAFGEESFEKILNEQFPMNPGEIEEFKSKLNETQKAFSKPTNGLITPISRSINLNLNAGEKIETINLATNNSSAVTFSDITGSPWPIESITNANNNAFDIKIAGKQGNSNIAIITPLTSHGKSNTIITLFDNPVPIPLILNSGQKIVDYRIDIQIQKRGPNALEDLIENTLLPPTDDNSMTSFLDGISPNGSKKLRTSNNSIEAWEYKDKYYIRTKQSLLSPAYISSARNISGTNIFVTEKIPVLQLSINGNLSRVSIFEN